MERRTLLQGVPFEANTVPARALQHDLQGLGAGQILCGRYRLVRWIGSGASAQVFEAIDLATANPVAVKVFSVADASRKMLNRFLQEAEHARELDHPNVIRVMTSGVDRDRHFLVTELLEGKDLARVLRAGKLPISSALRWFTHAAFALEYIHERSVLHRDIKPGNLFITRTGILKLMDFGLARSTRAPGATADGQVLGTPEYIAPEQASGSHPLTPMTDLYSLGVVAYELLTGRVPFQHPEIYGLMMQHVNDPPPPPRAWRPELPEQVEQIVLKLLEKEPARRIQSATELREQLIPLWEEIP
jgi:eukaryotic-like serine/threonine-protein kinase